MDPLCLERFYALQTTAWHVSHSKQLWFSQHMVFRPFCWQKGEVHMLLAIGFGVGCLICWSMKVP